MAGLLKFTAVACSSFNKLRQHRHPKLVATISILHPTSGYLFRLPSKSPFKLRCGSIPVTSPRLRPSSAQVSMPSTHEDADDLFGDEGSDGSLFGDGEDSGSLFGDEESDKTSAEMVTDAVVDQTKTAAVAGPLTPPTLALPSLSAITLPPLRDGPISVGLSLAPTGSDPHGALSCDHVGHTSDRQVTVTDMAIMTAMLTAK